MTEERLKNNEICNEIACSIINDINIDQYNDLDTSVVVFITVRKWSHIKSCWGHYALNATKMYEPYDLHTAKMNVGIMIDDVLNGK